MEWLLLAVVAAGAAVYVAWPSDEAFGDPSEGDRLREQRATLLDELAEYDSDLSLGRTSEADRQAGRRAVAPELRAVTERLRELNEPVEVGS